MKTPLLKKLVDQIWDGDLSVAEFTEEISTGEVRMLEKFLHANYDFFFVQCDFQFIFAQFVNSEWKIEAELLQQLIDDHE